MLRSYSQNMSPSAKKFFVRSICLFVSLETLERAGVQGGDGDLEHVVGAERPVAERARPVPDLREVARREGVPVDDERAARRKIADVRLERGRVHRDEDVRLIAGRVDLRAGEAELEPRHTGEGAGRGPDLGGVVGEGADVVAERGGGPRELGPRQLHPVAGVAGEPDGDPLQLLGGHVSFDRVCHAPSDATRR